MGGVDVIECKRPHAQTFSQTTTPPFNSTIQCMVKNHTLGGVGAWVTRGGDIIAQQLQQEQSIVYPIGIAIRIP